MRIFAAGRRYSPVRTVDTDAATSGMSCEKPRLNRISGNVFFALFAAVAMVGGVGYGFNSVLRGPIKTMTDVTRRTVAESTIVTSSRMAIVGATTQQATADCDSDGMIEPLPYRTAGAGLPAPTGGGYLPTGLVPDSIDPWNTEFGYCAWDSGSVTLNPTCGATPNRLAGAPNNKQYALAVISAGQDRKFQTTCVAYNGGTPNAPLITNTQGSDDIVLGYSYAEANDLGAGMWKVNAVDSTIAETRNALDVEGGGTFSEGIVLQGNVLTGGGLKLPEDPGDDTKTGGCNAANDKQLRRNIGTVPPSLEICNFSGGFTSWTALSGGSGGGGGGGGGGSCSSGYTLHASRCYKENPAGVDWNGARSACMADGGDLVSVNDVAEHNFLKTFVSDEAFVGLNDIATEGSFVWVDGTSSYSAWVHLEPNGGASVDCATIYPTGVPAGNFADVECSRNWHPYVCEKAATGGGGGGGGGGYTGDMVAHWKLDETSGTVAEDSVGSADGTLVNGVIWQPAGGYSGGSAQFTRGADTYIRIPRSAAFETTAFTATMWVKRQSNETWLSTVMRKNHSNNNAPIRLSWSVSYMLDNFNGCVTPNAVCFYSGHAGGPAGLTGATPIPLNQWTHVAVSYDPNGPAPQKRIYLNGVLDGSATLTDPLVYDTTNTGDLYMGTEKPAGGEEYGGALDDVRFFNYQLSDAQILDVYNNSGQAVFKSQAPAKSGRAMAWGRSQSGALGYGGTTAQTIPVPIQNGNDMQQITGGVEHGCGLKTGGVVWCWGTRMDGRLGDNSTTSQNPSPQVVPGLQNVAKISAATQSTCAVKRDGTVWCWGNNTAGQLGVGDTTSRLVPTKIPTLRNIIDISGGRDYYCAVDRDGGGWCWGLNTGGALGNGTTTDSPVPVKVINLSNFVSINAAKSTGTFHTCGVTRDGEGYCWGTNSAGQLGNNNTTSTGTPQRVVQSGGSSYWTDWAKIQPAAGYTCGLRASGAMYCWGGDTYSQLGNGATGASNAPSLVTRYNDFVAFAPMEQTVCAARRSGAVYCWGADPQGERGNGPNISATADSPEPALMNNVYQLSSAPYTLFALADSDKRVVTVDNARPSKLEVGSNHACAIDRDNSLWCWGHNGFGQLGIGGGGGNRDVPQRVPGTWTQLASNGLTNVSACGIRNDANIYCWGDDSRGELGNGAGGAQTSPGVVSVAGPWSQVASGYSQACALKVDGTVWCWGTNFSGTHVQTPSTAVSPNGTRFRQLATLSNVATCGITVEDEIVCAGNATGGVLGNGQNSGFFAETVLSEKGPWQSMSASLTSGFCAIKMDGSLWCWGSTDANGEMGSYGSYTVASALPWPVAEPGPWAKVSRGDTHTCAIKVDGSAWCWGKNSAGQLGAGPSYALANYAYPVRVVGGDYVDISSGVDFTCAMKKDDTVWCWGGENYDNLGNGSPAANSNVPVKVAGMPHREPFSVNTNGITNDLLPGVNADIGSTRYVSRDGGGAYGFNFAGSGRSQLTSPLANNFTVESVGTGGDAQISLKAAGSKGTTALPSGLVAWWRMEETSGTAVYDTVGGNNGTWTGSGSILSATGVVGRAFDFTANSTYVDLGTAPGLTSLFPVTVALWVYPRTNHCNGGFGICTVMYATDNDGPVAGGWFLGLSPTRQIRMGAEWPWVDINTNQLVPLNQWSHIVVSFSPPDLPRIYLNGVATNYATAPVTTIRPEDNGTPKAFGSAHTTGAHQWNVDGLLDELQVWNRPLSASEVLQVYNTMSNNSVTEVVRSFGMDFATGGFKISRNITGTNSWLGSLASDLDINNLGDVGIGTSGSPQTKLDVNGGLKVGNDGGACNAGKAGGIQWTGTALQYCDGSGSWKTFGIGGANNVLWDTRREALQNPWCSVRVDGTMWCWGDDWYGAFGNNTSDIKSLAYVPTHSDVSATPWTDWIMASGSCGLRANGTMWCWGANTTGRVGQGNTNNGYIRPVQVLNDVGGAGWTDWKYLGKGGMEDTVCGIRSNGKAYCWGDNAQGEVGNGTTSAAQSLPAEVHTNVGSPGWSDWVFVTSGEDRSCGIRSNGTAWCWGIGWNGAIGDGNYNNSSRPVQVLNNSGGAGWTDWKSLSVGGNLTCGLRTNGTAWCWGGPTAGMGDGSGANSPLPRQFSSNCFQFDDIVAIDTAGYHTCAVRANGSLWCAGTGFSGGVGAGDLNDYYCPNQVKSSDGMGYWYDWVNVSAQFFGTCATRSNGQRYCWGGTAWDDYGRYYPVRMQ